MPVSGLVVSLSQEPQLRAEALDAISREAKITLGEREGNRLAIVLDTDSSQEDRHIWDWLHSLPGIALLEVAFVGFDQPADRLQRQHGAGKYSDAIEDSGASEDSGTNDGRQTPSPPTQKSPSGNKDHRNDGC